jgi:hypothetical protein
MSDGAPRKVLNQAISQLTRRRDAPAPHTVKVDARTQAQLLAFAPQYGALITFYDLTDRANGDWSIFFQNDPSIALAMVACLDVSSIGTELRREIEALKRMRADARQIEALRRIVAAVLRLVRILDNGVQVRGSAGHGLARAIAYEIRSSLSAELRNFAIHTAALAPEPGLNASLDGLSDAWGISRAALGSEERRIAFSEEWIKIVIAALEDLVATLLAALSRLSAQARDMLEDSLKAKDHAPQSALYDAFVMLFRHEQDAVNTFPRRLVEYYYGTVLKQDSRSEVPDQVYLTFTPGKDIAETSVPKATVFPAGSEADGSAINYAAEFSLEVCDSAVAQLRTLRVSATQVLSGTVTLSDKPPAIAEPFPPFGATETGTQGSLTSSLASLGFAIASDTLMLTAGERKIELRLQIGPESWQSLQTRLAPLAKQLGLTTQQTLALLLQASFTLTYSTAGGWMSVSEYAVAPDTASSDSVMVLTFTLAAGAAPFVALSTTPPDQNAVPPAPGSPVPSQVLPVLMASLIQSAVTLTNGSASVQVYPYAVLSGLALGTLTLHATVGGFDAVTLTTPNGLAEQSQPFATLGSPPVQNGTLSIAAQELFVKRLDSLTITNDWYGIPTTSTGFKGYYEAYVEDADGKPLPPITNTSFLSTITVQNPGLWTLGVPKIIPGSDAPLYLFRTTKGNPVPDPCVKLLDSTVFDKLPVASATPPVQYDPTLSAVILTLTEPPYAFGDALYARNVMAASLRETSLAAACAQKCASAQDARAAEIKTLVAALDAFAAANTETPDKQYRQMLEEQLPKLLSQMTGTALKLIDDALGARPDLDAALSNGQRKGFIQLDLVSGESANGLSAADIARNLSSWLDKNAAAFKAPALAPICKVTTAQTQIMDAAQGTAKLPLSMARVKMTAAQLAAKSTLLAEDPQSVKDCIAACMGPDSAKSYPNAPWLPMTTSLRLDYEAESAFPNENISGDTYYYLVPFDGVAAVPWTAGSGDVPLLQPQPDRGALYIGLSGQPQYLTLLFQVTAGAHGFSSNPPAVAWAQQSSVGWTPLTPPDTLLANGTEGTSTDSSLQNTGIVSLKLAPPPGGADLLWLQLSVAKGADTFPLLSAVTTNALTARWIGPGGAQDLGLKPLPAGTITASDPPLADIAAIDQPLPSFGGEPLLKQRPFWMWMAERLRHKDRAIQGWDYATLALSEFPTLWQAEALPAQDENGRHIPGHVDMIVVAGRATPNISDRTEPLADQTLLEEVGAMAKARCSTFVTLQVDNPRYVRIAVTADLVFSPDDTVAAWIAKLNAELVQWLSPWEPPPELGIRPADYYDDFAVAEFVRNRPYVVAILSLGLSYDPPDETAWCYLTSVLEHQLSGELAS